MPRPFVAYLRVYEPLSAFPAAARDRMRAAAESGPLHRLDAGDHEQLMWLKSQTDVPQPTLPGELPDGEPAPGALRDLLVVDPAEVPPGRGRLGPGPLICPLDLRPRSAAAVVGFLATALPPLRMAALGDIADRLRQKAGSVLAENPGGAVHVVSTTWTVPLPWFVIVDPACRQVTLGESRSVHWLATMGDARRRVQRAHELAEQTFGDAGPTKVLLDTGRWLAHFHEGSAVELDYGGLVELMDDDTIMSDTSAEDVNAILDAIERPDPAEVATRFERLREFWSNLAIRERLN